MPQFHFAYRVDANGDRPATWGSSTQTRAALTAAVLADVREQAAIYEGAAHVTAVVIVNAFQLED